MCPQACTLRALAHEPASVRPSPFARYYATVERFDVAQHCLRAAEAVLIAARRKRLRESADAANVSGTAAAGAPAAAADGETATVCLNGTSEAKAAAEARLVRRAAEPPQRLTEDEAEDAAALDLAFVDLYLSVLRRALWIRTRSGQLEDESEQEGRALGPLEGLHFGELSLPPPSDVCANPALVRTFEDAREVFKTGYAYAVRAKGTYVLDGFVTSHFEVIERETELFAQLTRWEPSLARQHAMHKRRIELLRPPIALLSEKAYTQLVRQGLFDASVMAAEALEVKCAMLPKDCPKDVKATKLGADVALCVETCNEFLQRFETTAGGGDGDGEGGAVAPEKVEDEQERAYITCRFHLARAHGKLDSPESLGAALRQYELITAYLTRNKVEGMEQEAEVCSEMVELLPHKIKAAQRNLID